MTTQEIVNQKARCYMFWMIAGTMMADTSGSYLKLMYLPMLEDVNAIGSYSWGSATLAYLYRFLCKASQSIQNEIARFQPLLQIVGKRGTGDIFPIDLHRGPHATRWFAHFSWTNTIKHVLKVYRDALDSMTEDQVNCEPYTDDLIESLPNYCRAGRDMWHVKILIFCWDVVEVHLPDRVMRQFGLQQVIPTPFLFDSTHFRHDRRGRSNTNWELEHAQWLPFWNDENNISVMHQSIMGHFGMTTPTLFDSDVLLVFSLVILIPVLNANKARHIHSMVDKAKSLGDTPSYEDLYMFRKMVRDQSSDCLRYVHEADKFMYQLIIEDMRCNLISYVPLFVGEEKAVLLEEENVHCEIPGAC
ncbi:hypothetical protein P3L10_030991 [Capsicum annuum]